MENNFANGLSAFDQGMGILHIGGIDGAEVCLHRAANAAGVHEFRNFI